MPVRSSSTYGHGVERQASATVDGSSIPLDAVSSSNVAAAGYDAARQLLVCQFHGGAVYVYRRVPPRLFAEFSAAPSKGKFLQQRVVGHHAYPFERLGDVQKEK